MKQLLLGLAAAGVLASASVTAAPAAAASAIVEQAKDQCLVGEQADGYLGFVPGADISTALRREVLDINQQRKSGLCTHCPRQWRLNRGYGGPDSRKADQSGLVPASACATRAVRGSSFNFIFTALIRIESAIIRAS